MLKNFKLKIILRHIAEWFLVFLPILAQYQYGFSSVGMILTMAVSFVIILTNKKLYINKYLLIFTVFTIVFQLFNITRNTTGFNLWANNTFFPIIVIIIISTLIPILNLKSLLKKYLFIAIIAMIIMYYQGYVFNVLHKDVIQITILPLNDTLLHYWNNLSGGRPSSFFAEPQAYATYLIPLFYFLMKDKKYFLSTLFGFSVILSTSSLGIFSILIITILFIYKNSNLIKSVIIMILFILFVFVIYNTHIFDYAFSKIIDTNYLQNIRLTRGFAIIKYLGIRNIFFGLGAGELENFITHNYNILPSWVTYTSAYNIGYVTTISGVFISYGSFTFISYMNMHLKNISNSKGYTVIFAIIILMLPFVQTMLFSAVFLFYFTMFYLETFPSSKSIYLRIGEQYGK